MTSSTDPFAYDREQHEAQVRAFRSARLARLTAADGWLSLIGRFPLEEGRQEAGSSEGCSIALPKDRAPDTIGVFERERTLVTFTPRLAMTVSLRGGAAAAPLEPGVPVRLRTDREGTADKIALGSLTLEVTERESGLFVRVRDPDSPTRRQFAGIEHYPIDPRWRVVARLERYEPPREIELDYEADSVQQYKSPGAAVFEIDGVTHRLDPVFDEDRPRLYLVFWDKTARDTTYGAGRFLYSPLPEGDHVLLDFNEAFSPPCAFTPYAACPVGPAQNRLPLRVEAGEKRPH
jgi:uncharacterized protein (DUF1684 family)